MFYVIVMLSDEFLVIVSRVVILLLYFMSYITSLFYVTDRFNIALHLKVLSPFPTMILYEELSVVRITQASGSMLRY